MIVFQTLEDAADDRWEGAMPVMSVSQVVCWEKANWWKPIQRTCSLRSRKWEHQENPVYYPVMLAKGTFLWLLLTCRNTDWAVIGEERMSSQQDKKEQGWFPVNSDLTAVLGDGCYYSHYTQEKLRFQGIKAVKPGKCKRRTPMFSFPKSNLLLRWVQRQKEQELFSSKLFRIWWNIKVHQTFLHM